MRLLTFCLLLLNLASQAQPCREVIAYFPSWKWYDRNHLVNPASLDYSKYTIINYAFFRPEWDGSIVPFDPVADRALLLGDRRSKSPNSLAANKSNEADRYLPSASLVDMAHQNGVRVVISVGGWTMSEQFPSICASAEKRRRFAESCREIIGRFGVDGIDIDWEYPGYQAHNGSSADRENFTLLLEAIRDTFDVMTAETGKSYLLTSCFGVSPNRLAFIEWHKVKHLLDFVNLITYDYYGLDHHQTNHHSPLFSPAKGLTGYDMSSTVQHLMEEYDVPAHKITVGIPFYGKAIKTKGDPDLHVASRKSRDAKTFPEDVGSPMFYNILARQGLFNYQWDSLAQAPFLQGKHKLNTFVTYDDERSVAQKARFILEQNLAGAIVWDITGDYVESSPGSGEVAGTPLATALCDALCNRKKDEQPAAPTIFSLPPRLILVKQRSYAPRLAHSSVVLKIEKKKKKDKKRKKRKKEKGGAPAPYFDRSW
ncbi:MAG: glycosyl hydrolase family 18 protein [Bacteroidota bacterium]